MKTFRFLLLFFLAGAGKIAFAQDSCGCVSIFPYPDEKPFATVTRIGETKPYTGICHIYYMKIPGKLADYSRTLEYGVYKNGKLQFSYRLGDKGDTQYVFRRLQKDSLIGESRSYENGKLESRYVYYSSQKHTKCRIYGYDTSGYIKSVANAFYPQFGDTLSPGYVFSAETKTDPYSRDIPNILLLEGPYFEYGGKNGKTVTAKGQYHLDKPSGNWNWWYPSGKPKATGAYSRYNWKNGRWTEWYENGNKKSEIDYTNDNKTGIENEWFENGQPKLIATHPLVRKPAFAYYEGVYEEYWPNGKLKKKAFYKNGFYSGTTEEWFENGQLYLSYTYNDSMRTDGHWQEWYENGVLKNEKFYSDGNSTAPEKGYWQNGKLQFEISKTGYGIPDGRQKWYYESGVLKSDENFSMEKKDGECRYYFPSGKIARIEHYEKDRENGEFKTYSADGMLLSVVEYDHGDWQGTCKWYFPDGKPWREFNYKIGERNGVCTEWNEQGKVVYSKTFKNGKPAAGNDITKPVITKNCTPQPNTACQCDSVVNAYRRDAVIAAVLSMNPYFESNPDSIYKNELLPPTVFQDEILADLVAIYNFIPAGFDSLRLVHTDSAQQTYVRLFFPYTGRKIPGDTAARDQDCTWPADLDLFIAKLGLKPVPGECYSAGNYDNRVVRSFTSDRFFNGYALDSVMKKINPQYECRVFTPVNDDYRYEMPSSLITRYAHDGYADYKFRYLLPHKENEKLYYKYYDFRVYADGSVDMLYYSLEPVEFHYYVPE